MKRILMPHQEDAVKRLSNGKILVGDVGVGKSFIASTYYARNESPKDVYVITTAKKRDSHDWEQEFVNVGVGVSRDATVHGIIKVDSWNNIQKYVDVKDAFFIFDEQRLVGSGVWVKSFLKIVKANNWILLSATPGDTWLDYIPVFLANGFYKNRTQFKSEHVVYSHHSKFPKVERYLGTKKLERLRDSVIVVVKYDRHTTRYIMWTPVEHDQKAVKLATKTRWDPFKDEPMKDAGGLFRVVRRLSNEDPSRVDRVKELMLKHPKLIIFYNFDYELDLLRTLSDDITTAEWNGHKHEDIPKTDRWLYFVQYTAGSEGWNCIETDAMVFYSLTYSYKTFYQAQGRIDRLNTPYTKLYYYVLNSSSWLDLAIKKAIFGKKDFNESGFSFAKK